MDRPASKVSAISFCMIAPIDIFRVIDNGEHLWIEPSQTMNEATVRVRSLGMGEYLIADQRTGVRVSLCVDRFTVKAANGN